MPCSAGRSAPLSGLLFLGFLLAQVLVKKSCWCDFGTEDNDCFTCRAKADLPDVGAATFLWPLAHSAFSARLSGGSLHARALQQQFPCCGGGECAGIANVIKPSVV